ncbi:MAG: acyltransferase [Ruminococcaceae bacterium]|nr:acyltransferase [Oscillospiraceae bacterium]
MIIFFLLYIVLCIYGMKFHTNLNQDYLSIDNTQSIKGIFIILVFLSHFNSYVNFENSFDLLYKNTVSMFGQTMVTLFLFYSGYGVMESINKKGINYLKQFPVKRILSTLFKFACAVFIFFLIGTFFIGEKYTLSTVLLSLIGWKSLGNSNWYIFVILVLYLITYISYRFLLQKNRIFPLIISFILVAALIFLNLVYKVKPNYWIDTAFCYVAGMIYSQYRKTFESIINKNNLIYCAITILALLTVVFLNKYSGHIISLIALNLCFVGVVVLLTMRITLKNKIILWCGENLFELYILQRVPMIIFKQIRLSEFNIYLYFILCVISTLLLVWPFKYITDKLWKMVLKTPLLFRREKTNLI